MSEQGVQVVSWKELSHWATNEWDAEASELGFPPGFWPETIQVMLEDGCYVTFERSHGDATGVVYASDDHRWLTILND